MHASRSRVTALLAMLVVLAWLPGAAVEWLASNRLEGWPRVDIVAEPDRGRPYPAPPAPPLNRFEHEGVPSQFDLRGNEIVRPVARYRVDHRGALYELHSPLTEVPRLSPPQL